MPAGAQHQLLLVVRIPKSASATLADIALASFPERRAFAVPNTLSFDGELSWLQRLRHLRQALSARTKNGTVSRTFATIQADAQSGDLLLGGHADFRTCQAMLRHTLKMLVLVRNPYHRALSEYGYARESFAQKTAVARFEMGILPRIAGRFSFDGYLDFLVERRETFGDIACKYIGVTAIEDVAAHFKRHVFHFGTVERLGAFVQSLEDRIDRSISTPHLSTEPLPDFAVLSRSHRRKLELLYGRDLALYEWCRSHAPCPKANRSHSTPHQEISHSANSERERLKEGSSP
jgi:hypothetical protein